MVLVNCHVAPVAGPIRFDGPVRALLRAVVRRFPGILGPAVAILCRIGSCRIQKAVPVVFQVPGRIREHAGKEWQHEQLRIPERMASVFLAAQKLGSHVDPVVVLAARAHQMEEGKTNGAVQIKIAPDLDVGLIPHAGVHFDVAAHLHLEAIGGKAFDLVSHTAVKLIIRDFAFRIDGGVFYYLHSLSLFCVKVLKFHRGFAKRSEAPVLHHGSAPGIGLHKASGSHAELPVSRRHLHIGAFVGKRAVCEQPGMLHLKARRIAEVYDGAIDDIFHLDDPAVV